MGIVAALKAYAATTLAVVLALALAWQTLQLHGAQRSLDQAEAAHAMAEAGWANERAEAATSLALAATQAREIEQQIAADAAQTEADKNAQIHALTGRAADLAGRLRNARATAATDRLVSAATAATGAAEAPGICDSGGLSDRVGDGLVQLALRADQVRLQLASCEKQYDSARAALSRGAEK